MVSIGSYAFASCSSLKTVTILPIVITISDFAFYGDSALTRFNGTEINCMKVLYSCLSTCTQFKECPDNSPSRAPIISLLPTTLFTRSPTKLLPSIITRAPSSARYPQPTESSTITINNTITCSSCYQCSTIPNLNYYFTAVIPSGYTAIVTSAFDGCFRLIGIIIPT